MRRTLRAAWCAAAALLLAGCAMTPVDDPRRAFNEHVRAMESVDEWVIRGRLAVKTSKRGETANMYWRREQSEHYINLYGPFGAGRVILTRNEDGATLRNEKGTYHDDSAEELLYRAVGWRVPFRSMQHWVLGVAAPDGEHEMELDDRGRLETLTQNGWRISFEDYHEENRREVPRRMVMNALPGTEHIAGDTSGENETIQVKALIERWD